MGPPVRKTKRSRKAPDPNSILDRKALEQALDDRGLTIKSMHIDTFYQALHRQHYPDLPEFVENYYRFEREASGEQPQQRSTVAGGGGGGGGYTRPLKNNVSAKKNMNKRQLPRKLLEFLQDPKNGFVTVSSKVALQKTSADETTTKLAVQLHDGQLVESVLMRYITKGGSRASLCVSSQCGCAMGCTFCATGTMGLSGNLTTGEILEQVVHADRILAEEWKERQGKENTSQLKLDLVRNIVFMGMGEPLDNYSNVVGACRALIDPRRWNMGHSKITVSTVGLVGNMRKLTKELPEVCLALSLHAPNQEMRSAIVPTGKHYPLEDLIDALDGHMMAYLRKRNPSATVFSKEQRVQESSRRRAMIEYVMLDGDTSSLECAHQLGKLCDSRQLIVNLIPYNQTDVKDKLRCPTEEHMQEFRRIVSSYGAFCTIRRTMGADIDSACGQLVTLKKKDDDTKEASVRDIEDAAPDASQNKEAAVPVVAKSKRSKKADESSVSPVDLDRWVQPLAVATAVAASCFVVSTILVLRQRRR